MFSCDPPVSTVCIICCRGGKNTIADTMRPLTRTIGYKSRSHLVVVKMEAARFTAPNSDTEAQQMINAGSKHLLPTEKDLVELASLCQFIRLRKSIMAMKNSRLKRCLLPEDSAEKSPFRFPLQEATGSPGSVSSAAKLDKDFGAFSRLSIST